MKEPIDVKSIHDIPNITEYLDVLFPLNCYDVGDKTQIYVTGLNDEKVCLEIISDESLITNEEKLVDLITQENIYYLGWSLGDLNGNTLQSYSYRPLVDESEKNYI